MRFPITNNRSWLEARWQCTAGCWQHHVMQHVPGEQLHMKLLLMLSAQLRSGWMWGNRLCAGSSTALDTLLANSSILQDWTLTSKCSHIRESWSTHGSQVKRSPSKATPHPGQKAQSVPRWPGSHNVSPFPLDGSDAKCSLRTWVTNPSPPVLMEHIKSTEYSQASLPGSNPSVATY